MKFTLEDIPEGGYFTYQLLDASETVFSANSFSKEFLKDKTLRSSLFSMNREPVSTCINKEANFKTVSRTDLDYVSTESGGLDYNFISQVAEKSQPAYSTDSLDVYAVGNKMESTVLFQYKDTEKTDLHQYGVRDWSKETPLSLVGMSGGPASIQNPESFKYETLDMQILVGDYSYDVAQLPSTTTQFSHPDEPKTETWAFNVMSELPIHGWHVALNQKIYQAGSWDINIDPSEYYDLTTLPDSFSVNGSTIDTGFSFFEENKGFSRLAYRSEANTGLLHRVTHKIFTKLDSDVEVPELYYYNFSNQAKNELKVSDSSQFAQTVLLKSEDADISAYDFMSQFSHGDVVDLDMDNDGLVISEVELNKISTHAQKSDFMLLMK